MRFRSIAALLTLIAVVLGSAVASAQGMVGSNLRNVFDAARNLGALRAYAARGVRPDLYPVYAAGAPAEWTAAWSDPPVPLDPAGLVPPYDVTARDYLSSLGQAVFEHAAGCGGTPWSAAYALWVAGSSLESINADAPARPDCLDCLSQAWARLVPRLEAIGRFFPSALEFAEDAREMAANPPRTTMEVPDYGIESANLAQAILGGITTALGDGTAFFACRGGTLVEVPPGGFSLADARATGLRFYEGPWEGVPQGQRRYATAFSSEAARTIHYELRLEYPPPPTTVPFEITAIWTREDGRILSRQRLRATLPAGERSTDYWQGWGKETPGAWQPGTYRVELLVAGRRVVDGSFTVTDRAPQPTACPTSPIGTPHLETHTPGQIAVLWHRIESLGFSCPYSRAGAPVQGMLRVIDDGYALYRVRNGVPVWEYRLVRNDRPAPPGWDEGGLGYAVEPDGRRRSTGSTAPWTGRRPQ
jgi:hypothetical protein